MKLTNPKIKEKEHKLLSQQHAWGEICEHVIRGKWN